MPKRRTGDLGPVFGAGIALGLFVLVLICQIAHATGFLKLFDVPESQIMEVLLACAVTTVGFLWERFRKTEKHLDRLSGQVETASHVSRFLSKRDFTSRWKTMSEQHEVFYFWGVFNQDVIGELFRLQGRRKSCSYYLPIDDDQRQTAIEFLKNSPSSPDSDLSKLYETASSGSHSWIIAEDKVNDRFEALICFSKPGEALFSGVHLTGITAKEYSQSVLPRPDLGNNDSGTEVPIRLYTERQINAVIGAKNGFKARLSEVVLGEETRGFPSTFQLKKEQLRKTVKSLRATHVIKNAAAVAMMKNEYFVDWMNENYEKRRKDKKFEITRIVITTAELERNQDLNEHVAKMKSEGINILAYNIERLGSSSGDFDFCIFDESHVNYYISREEPVVARHSDDQKIVKRRIKLYESIKRDALPWGQMGGIEPWASRT